MARIFWVFEEGLNHMTCLGYKLEFAGFAGEKVWYQMMLKNSDAGKPFNIASYALLTLMVAQAVGLKPGDFVHTLGDAHIYANHFEQAKQQLARAPRPLPVMQLNPDVKDLFGFQFQDFTLVGYEADSSIKAPIAV